MQLHIKGFMEYMESGSDNIFTGLRALDGLIFGLQKGCLYTIAGRPSMGKTSLSLNIALNASSMFGISTAFFSYEMTEEQIKMRLDSRESGIELDRLLRKDLRDYEREQLANRTRHFKDIPLFIHSISTMDIDELTSTCKELKSNQSVKLFIIDDIQRVTINEANRRYADNREQEVSNNVRRLKSLAKELRTPILIISQLNRQVELREGDKRPWLIDPRDSGAIENDSDVVIFIYRPEYYGLTENEEGVSTHSLAELIVAKNRNGAPGSVRVKFEAEYSKFSDLDTEDSEF